MLKNLKKQIILLNQNNLKGYILLSIVFIIGMLSALILGVNSFNEEEIKIYIKDYITNITSSGTDIIQTFNLSMINYIKFALIMFFSAVTIVGVPTIFIYMLIEGFSLGTVICCLFKAFGTEAILIFLSTVIPHIAITVPCCLLYALHCIKNSCNLITCNTDFKKHVLRPVGFGILFLCTISIAALIQAYIEPFFVKLISSQFV